MSDNRFSIFKGLALITHMGLLMVIPIIAGVYLGGLLDTKFNTGNLFLIVLTIIGVMTGFMNIYKTVMKDIKKDKS